jgi:hypothetical protein
MPDLFRQRFRCEAGQGTYVMHFAASGEEALDRLSGKSGPHWLRSCRTPTSGDGDDGSRPPILTPRCGPSRSGDHLAPLGRDCRETSPDENPIRNEPPPVAPIPSTAGTASRDSRAQRRPRIVPCTYGTAFG